MLYIAVVPEGSDERTASHPEAVARFYAAIQAGDDETLRQLLAPDAVTSWPQSGERVTGALACVRVYESYPGGVPHYSVERVTGGGDVWVAELTATYGEERWFAVSIFEFDDGRIARITEYFGAALPAPEWRRELVDPVILF